MTDKSSADRHQRDDIVGELIRRAGRREQPSTEQYDQVLDAASRAFHDKVRQRRQRFVLRAVAAVLIAGVSASWLVTRLMISEPQSVAMIDRVTGPVQILAGEDRWETLQGDPIVVTSGQQIRTGAGSRAGFRMHNGVSLRLAEATEVLFLAPDRVRLVAGKVYADSDPDPDPARDRSYQIAIETEVGLVSDIGTQFEVRYQDEIFRLSVREGRVNLQQPDRELQRDAGQQLTIDADRSVFNGQIARDNYQWQWTESVAPDPIIDGHSVSALLEWVARQTGRQVEYVRPELRSAAESTILYGQVFGLEPFEALDAMLATTDFDYTLQENGIILVDSRADR